MNAQDLDRLIERAIYRNYFPDDADYISRDKVRQKVLEALAAIVDDQTIVKAVQLAEKTLDL